MNPRVLLFRILLLLFLLLYLEWPLLLLINWLLLEILYCSYIFPLFPYLPSSGFISVLRSIFSSSLHSNIDKGVGTVAIITVPEEVRDILLSRIY
ncbi:hypothetical protein F5Y09DRAFT_108032 [Xylaria sp. FL1042]|nr:hypothetical protein F5Y09DRAFT_108032 [Xylaria sp. FL1042]